MESVTINSRAREEEVKPTCTCREVRIGGVLTGSLNLDMACVEHAPGTVWERLSTGVLV